MNIYGNNRPKTPENLMEGSSKAQKAFSAPFNIQPKSEIILDWTAKQTGWLQISGSGQIDYQLASDLRLFDLYAQNPPQKAVNWPSCCVTSAIGSRNLTDKPEYFSPNTHAFRYLKLINNSGQNVEIKSIELIPSEFPEIPAGSFHCDLDIINTGWKMGLDTVHLCTQPGDQSYIPVYPPFANGYVQWDGCRRDREIWGGDLRPSALCWYYNFTDNSPILNSLYILLSGQHVACADHGAFPGSGSTRQLLPEWCFWIVTALWEYILHTGNSLPEKFLKYTLNFFLEWCRNKLASGEDKYIPGSATWMYTFNFDGSVLPGIQTSALNGLAALENLFNHLDQPEKAKSARKIKNHLLDYVTKNLYNPKYNTLAINIKNNGCGSHSDLVSTCWALESNAFDPAMAERILKSLKNLHWTPSGSINVAPPPNVNNLHNNNIWPFANAYEFASRLKYADTQNALELFKRYTSLIRNQGHSTLFEMINIDGSLPIDRQDGNTLSFCHAWGGLGTWALQRYLLGPAPTAPGWKTFNFNPVPSSLKYCKGSVVTPKGIINIELESDGKSLKGRLHHPAEIKCTQTSPAAEKIEITSK